MNCEQFVHAALGGILGGLIVVGVTLVAFVLSTGRRR